MQLFNVKSITDSELFERIEEYCDMVMHPVRALNEMAYERKEIMEETRHQLQNLVTNWCLIQYVDDNGDDNNLRPHWVQEFCNACVQIQSMDIKKGNDKVKEKAIREELFKKFEIDGKKGRNKLLNMVLGKFEEEGFISISWSNERCRYILEPYIESFMTSLDDIIRLLVEGDRMAVRDYMNEYSD